jgi:hypothetical protein
MTRKAGFLVLAALALSVAALGLFLCARCEHAEPVAVPAPHVETLMIGDGSAAE